MNRRFIGSTVTALIDRPIGSHHPKYEDLVYPINYGYIPGTLSPDGEELDCYILGVYEPKNEYTGVCIAVIHRLNDDDDKLIIAPRGARFTKSEIEDAVSFQERYFDHEVFFHSEPSEK